MRHSSSSLVGRAVASTLIASLSVGSVAQAQTAPAIPPPAPVESAPVPTDGAVPAAATTPEAGATATTAKPAEPPPPPAPPTNPKLESAKALMLKKRYDDALKDLAAADGFPENTQALRTEIKLTRAQALLSKKKPDVAGAKAIVLEFLHADPDGSVFVEASPEIRNLVSEIRETQPLVVHEPVLVSRPNRPLKIKASLRDRTGKAEGLTLFYKSHGSPAFYQDPFKRESDSYSVLLKSPLSVAPEGVTDEFSMDYYIAAVDASGRVLDTNTPPEQPLTLRFSTTGAAEADKAKGINLAAIENPLPPPVQTVVVDPPKPWYLRWYTLTAAGVVVAGSAAAIIYAATRESPLPPHTDKLQLPLGATP